MLTNRKLLDFYNSSFSIFYYGDTQQRMQFDVSDKILNFQLPRTSDNIAKLICNPIFDTSFIKRNLRKSAHRFGQVWKISAKEDKYSTACNSHLQDRDLWRYSYRYPQFLENWMFSFCHFSTPLLLKSVVPKAWITWVSYSWWMCTSSKHRYCITVMLSLPH